jgi:hypothetical protein
MPKSIKEIVSHIADIMRKNGNEAITLKWDQFYKICDRERIESVILERVEKELKKSDMHVVYANSTVIVVRDFYWKPVTI